MTENMPDKDKFLRCAKTRLIPHEQPKAHTVQVEGEFRSWDELVRHLVAGRTRAQGPGVAPGACLRAETPTGGPPGSRTECPMGPFDDGIMLTWVDGDTARLTVRGKDHDLDVEQLRALARAANRAADAIETEQGQG